MLDLKNSNKTNDKQKLFRKHAPRSARSISEPWFHPRLPPCCVKLDACFAQEDLENLHRCTTWPKTSNQNCRWRVGELRAPLRSGLFISGSTDIPKSGKPRILWLIDTFNLGILIVNRLNIWDSHCINIFVRFPSNWGFASRCLQSTLREVRGGLCTAIHRWFSFK